MQVGKVTQLTNVKIVKQPKTFDRFVVENANTASDPDDDLRRLMLGMLAMLKRRYPDDWRRMVQEINEAKAA